MFLKISNNIFTVFENYYENRIKKYIFHKNGYKYFLKISRGESAALGQPSFFKKYERENLEFFT